MAHDQRDDVNLTESTPFSFHNRSYYMTRNDFATHGIPRYASPAPPRPSARSRMSDGDSIE